MLASIIHIRMGMHGVKIMRGGLLSPKIFLFKIILTMLIMVGLLNGHLMRFRRKPWFRPIFLEVFSLLFKIYDLLLISILPLSGKSTAFSCSAHLSVGRVKFILIKVVETILDSFLEIFFVEDLKNIVEFSLISLLFIFGF